MQIILETAGDPRTIDFGRMMHLEQGGHWAEGDIGTNAIGTAIAALQPVQIHGVEHFCSDVQRWTCAATPIWHPTDRELLGILDISGPATTFNPQSLAFAGAVGRQIESMLAQSIKDDHKRLLRYLVSKRSHWLAEDIVAIDRRGVTVYATNAAVQVLEQRSQSLISDGRISCLKQVSSASWPARLSQFTDHLIPFHCEFAAYIFQPSTPEFCIVWVQKNKECMLFAVPALMHQKQFSRQGFHLIYFEILQE
jgi:sigma-54 dependent transcriptional regulator, acetoin dehydrogenase operon transcriptional activator AcoR